MICVLIVDEVPLIGNVISSILQEEKDIKVIGQAMTLAEAQEMIHGCNIVLMSTTLPDKAALNLTRQLAKANGSAKVVAMGLPEAEEVILRYVEAGIAGYILRDDTAEELIRKIRAISEGEAPVSSQIAAALMERVAALKELCDDDDDDKKEERNGQGKLTAREQEVLGLLEQGLTNQEIAQRLVIEVGTVKNHVHSILKKLNLSSRREVVDPSVVKSS